MNTLQLAWLLGRPSHSRLAPQLLTASAYAMVGAMLLVVLGGAWSFTSFEPGARGFYLPLAGVAVVLLAVPLMVLGAAAARLSARTHDRALSSLRLLGATAGQVRRVAVVQAAGTALAGALGGVLLYLALSPLVAQLRFQGGPLGSAVLLPAWVVALVVVAVALLAVGGAVAGLRRLVITPLAVATRQPAPAPSWVRVVVGVVVVALLYSVFTNLGALARDLATMVVVVVGGFGLGMLVMNLVGPWLVAMVGRRRLATAESPAALLAARMVLDDPAGAWRQVQGVAMASFVAVVGGSGAALMQVAGQSEPTGTWQDFMAADVFTGVLLTLAITFLCVACSATITQTATTLDLRDLYRGLHRLGMPYQVMNSARTTALMVPALTASIGFALASVALVLPLAGVALLVRPVTVLIVAATVVVGLVLVRLAIQVADPRRLLAH